MMSNQNVTPDASAAAKALGRIGGLARSERKAQAARENGLLGGKITRADEVAAVEWLRRATGVEVTHCNSLSPYDCICNGWRVEIKTCFRKVSKNTYADQTYYWGFHIVRRKKGLLDDKTKTDFYLLRFLQPDVEPIHVLVRAPLGKSVLHIPEARLPGLIRRSTPHVLAQAVGPVYK